MKRFRLLFSLVLVVPLLSAGLAQAVGTRRFVLDEGGDFKGGDLEGVAVDAAGGVRAGLSLGSTPVSQAVTIWSALALKDGTLLLGTGNDGKLVKVTGGTSAVVAETKALAVTSLVEAWGGKVVLGTLPEAKLFSYERDKLAPLATLKGAEHIWQVAYDAKANVVYAATGPEGKLFRITANGDAQVYFDAEEQQLMSVAVAPDGSVYAGASDKAKLYKITAPGRASVLYDFERTEVRAIAVSAAGRGLRDRQRDQAGLAGPGAPGQARRKDRPRAPCNPARRRKRQGHAVSLRQRRPPRRALGGRRRALHRARSGRGRAPLRRHRRRGARLHRRRESQLRAGGRRRRAPGHRAALGRPKSASCSPAIPPWFTR